MHHPILKIAQGRSDAVKQSLADKLATALTAVLGVNASAVEEVPTQGLDAAGLWPRHQSGGRSLAQARPG
ncbi:tautomerase family protein [Frateuria defendens]|uniref:tautomerase family protein n=1 Tax=Frateuria defendens TaxID=2219559 RepID=UPI001929A144|nr:4-oxalocrotonate tautomerase [Frateuria defendens]